MYLWALILPAYTTHFKILSITSKEIQQKKTFTHYVKQPRSQQGQIQKQVKSLDVYVLAPILCVYMPNFSIPSITDKDIWHETIFSRWRPCLKSDRNHLNNLSCHLRQEHICFIDPTVLDEKILTDEFKLQSFGSNKF